MGQTTPPATIAQFKAQFPRDFKYGSGLETVRNEDIQAALNLASTIFNPTLFDTSLVGLVPNQTSEALMCYLNASAHFLVLSLQAAGGLSAISRYQGPNSQGTGVVTNKGVGGVSIGYEWPSAITDNPALYQLTQTAYGQTYLQVAMLKLVGNVSIVAGENAQLQGLNDPFDV
jgi:hypothetical protein